MKTDAEKAFFLEHGYLHVQGVRTIVLHPDAPECEALHEPWSSSGIMLAPLILGYSTVSFPGRSRKRRRGRARNSA